MVVSAASMQGLVGCTPERPDGVRAGRDQRAHTSEPPSSTSAASWRVTRVIDGDTVEVRRAGRELTVRMIGMDTPEAVDPDEPVECFGPEATEFAVRTLLGRRVSLEFDASQGRRDYYGRALAYVWVLGSPSRMFNVTAIRHGYASEYTYDDAYRWQQLFRRAEAKAQQARRGVWSCPTPGS